MARTINRGFEYFPMDVDIFSDMKIRKLIKYHGGQALSIYALLLCKIYKNGYYIEWDDEYPFLCAEITGYSEDYIVEVIERCLAIGLFSKDMFDKERVLTSKGVQLRYSRICSQCRRICNISEYNLLGEKQQSQDDNRKVTKSKKQVYNLSLEQELKIMKEDESWLNGLKELHSIDVMDDLTCHLDNFKAQCIADGKQGHQSLQDAKQHFNSWLRILITNKQTKDEKVKSKRNNQRRSNVVSAVETKTYSNSF